MPTGQTPPEPTERPLARADLGRIAARSGVPTEVVEKDYILSYLLAGLREVPDLRHIRFKGGTALKKVYFGDYRFSEDLDFSAVNGPLGPALDTAVATAGRAAEARLRARGRFQLVIDRWPLRDPHPGGQDAFRVLAAFPWQNRPMVRVTIEVTRDEPVLLPTPERPILHRYHELGEQLDDVRLATYALEEIVAEKLRTLRQTQVQLEGRGWRRPRARDYYDLWRILSERWGDIDPELVRRILPVKFAWRGVSYSTAGDFFTPQLLAEARRRWRSNLGMFVGVLPGVDPVLAALRPLVERLVGLP
jgi:predicted nucleotidyltransferase component of viral defense system